jgi:surfactin synthase thioesterase subunit/NAD(P)-dependent dehydrogenase (short-subunit alcohol dehydrogenase family)/acyl carrier protein
VLAPALAPAEAAAPARLNLSSEGTYLVTGGLGGLGLATARWLAERGAGHVVLMSRSADESARERHAAALAGIASAGARVSLAACDVADPQALRAQLVRLRADQPPLRGVIHAAGQNWRGRIAETDASRVLAALRIKAGAAAILDEATRDLDLDLFVLFSSVAALWGTAGLAHYSAANRAMDALAEERQRRGLPATSIQWGPWGETGMSADAQTAAMIRAVGLPLIPPAAALAALEAAVLSGDPGRLVASFDWRRFATFADFSLCPGLFAGLRSGLQPGEGAAAESLAARLRPLAPQDARERICALILAELAGLVPLPPDISGQHAFASLGIDSLSAIGLALRLEGRTGIALSPMVAYTHPTIGDVAELILTTLMDRGPEAVPPAAVPSLCPPRRAGAKRMICLPYAGAAPAAMAGWQQLIGPAADIVPLWPGTETAPLAEQAEALGRSIAETGGTEALFGHSLGARLAFETARVLAALGAPVGLLILSGLGPGPLDTGGTPLHRLPEGGLAALAAGWHGGAAEAWPGCGGLLTALRDDLARLDAAGAVVGDPVACPVLILGGRDDTLVPPRHLLAWQDYASGPFSLRLLPGGHLPFRSVPAPFFAALRSAMEALTLRS